MFSYRVFLNNSNTKILYLFLVLVPAVVVGESTCDDGAEQHNRSESLKFKLAAIASILVAGGIGVSLPQLGRKIDALNPENDIFFMVKAFAAGVILATGFVHILPDAFETLTSPCLKESLWRTFPFTGFIAMMLSIGTLMVDSLASGYYKRSHYKKDKQAILDEHNKAKQVIVDEEKVDHDQHGGHVHIHTHTTHGHAHGSAIPSQDQETHTPDLLRHRIISQVKAELWIFFILFKWVGLHIA